MPVQKKQSTSGRGRGRPPVGEQPFDKRLHIRFDSTTYDTFETLCLQAKYTVSDAIRRIVDASIAKKKLPF